MAIYDTMQSLKSPGYAYNLAGFLLAAGEKADDVHNEANELLRIRDYLFGELAKKTWQPIEKAVGGVQISSYKADSGSSMSTGDGKLQEMEIQCAEGMGREFGYVWKIKSWVTHTLEWELLQKIGMVTARIW
ncbi:hypothetical protein KSP40_PGU013655 [Platanthera guangdongensis]|uniref:Uncharacterized protein n=1 Tax=Platanthera guangdongensis TaxID=2320717 RepID=A0ABR2LTK3_9ASPA